MGAQQRAEPERFTIHTPREPLGIGVDPSDDPRLIAFREMLRKRNPVLMARDRFEDRHRMMARFRPGGTPLGHAQPGLTGMEAAA